MIVAPSQKVQFWAISVMPVAEIWETLSWSSGKDRLLYSPLARKVEVYDAGPPVKVIVTQGTLLSRRESPGPRGEATEKATRAESRMVNLTRRMVVLYIVAVVQGCVLYGLEQRGVFDESEYEYGMDWESASYEVLYMSFLPEAQHTN